MMPSPEIRPLHQRAVSRAAFLRLSLFGLLLLTGLGLVVWAGTDWKAWAERLTNLHPAAFLGAMSLLPVIGFPISAFYFFAGVIYGWALGIPLCLAALAINMSLSYVFTRTLLRAPLSELVRKRGLSLPSVKTPTNQFRVTFLLRTVPGPPFSLQNYLLALAGIPFAIYLPVSLVAQGAIGSLLIVTSSLLTLHLDPWFLIVGAILFFITTGLIGSIFFSRRERRQNASAPLGDDTGRV